MGRFATLLLVVVGGGAALTACDDRVLSAQDEAEGVAATARPVPPAGYQVKWSKCARYIEGDAKVLNNSRVVKVASDGTVPLQRAEPVSNPQDNFRRVVASRVPNKLIGGEGVLREAAPRSSLGQVVLALGADAPRAPEKVAFVKLGQVVATREPNGGIAHWVVSSESLGEPVSNEDGELEYQDTCFRNPNVAGRDTAGYFVLNAELARSCVVEQTNAPWNSLSAYGFTPLVNEANMTIPSADRLHPDRAAYVGFDGTSFKYTGMGAALNDINGTERHGGSAAYYEGRYYCHMIVSAGFEVPGAKRPATRSLPAPGVVDGKSFIVWRPVNPNINIANDQLEQVPVPEALEPAPAPEPAFEPAPEPAEVPVDADAVVPM